jgi:hypothetical protein
MALKLLYSEMPWVLYILQMQLILHFMLALTLIPFVARFLSNLFNNLARDVFNAALVSFINQRVTGSSIINSWQHLSKLLNVWVLRLKTSQFLVSHAETSNQLLGVQPFGFVSILLHLGDLDLHPL